MSKSPLRDFLDETGATAEGFAADKGLSAWNVRHWARGDKLPALASQLDIEKATDGRVTPSMWLNWSIARQASAQPANPARASAA
jgi:hypothetical protein